MDDRRVSCERAVTSVRMIAPIQGGDTESGDLLRVAHRTEAPDQLLRNKLLTVVSELIETMADALAQDREAARECVHHVSAALLSCARAADESVDTASVEPNARRADHGGLAPWQVRSVTTFIHANLNTSVSCEMLARLARLSVSHFARAFKCTFGDPPHVFLMRRRMERAQGLMLRSNAPLAHIALECGFADQAHLSRLFLQFTGESPASWRRARASEAR
jgi:AraC family transcriptional regulator